MSLKSATVYIGEHLASKPEIKSGILSYFDRPQADWFGPFLPESDQKDPANPVNPVPLLEIKIRIHSILNLFILPTPLIHV